MPTLSGAEFKVLVYVARRTFGFHREAASISLSQLCGGLVTRAGQYLDSGTGLSKTQAVAAVARLEERGLLAVRRVGNVKGKATGANTYTLWVEDEDGVVRYGDEGDCPNPNTNPPPYPLCGK